MEFSARTSRDCSLITGGAPFSLFSVAMAARYDYMPESLLEMRLFIVNL